MKEKPKNILKTSKGITLIALVVTILVLLILAAVSISMLGGENGIITQAQKSKEETRAGNVEEKKNLWKTNSNLSDYTGEDTQSLEELLNDLENEKNITNDERKEIEEKGYVEIGSKDIFFTDGLKTVSYTITSSLDEVVFNKIIKEGDVKLEKSDYTNYTIEGISNSKDGEFITNGNVEGKSGNLEIIGDINDATFKYNLTNFMQGDEIFYCKVSIDGEIYYKEIQVIQGDSILYEEDFIGITYNGDWKDDINENYANKKAKTIIRWKFSYKILWFWYRYSFSCYPRRTCWIGIVKSNKK